VAGEKRSRSILEEHATISAGHQGILNSLLSVFSDVNEPLPDYLVHELVEPGLGKRRVVSRHKGFQDSRLVSEEDAMLLLNFATMCSNQTRGEHVITAKVFHGLADRHNIEVQVERDIADRLRKDLQDDREYLDLLKRKMMEGGIQIPVRTAEISQNTRLEPTKENIRISIPTTKQGIRKLFEGKHSLASYVPSLQIHDTPSGYAYVHIRPALDMFFATKKPIDKVYGPADLRPLEEGKVQTIWESKKMQEIFEKLEQTNKFNPSAVKIAVIEWSDGCAPGSINFSKRSSAHVITISVRPPKGFENDEFYTFPIAVGPEKDGDPDEVRRVIYKEIEVLMATHEFFYAAEGATIKVQLIFLLALMDRPERSYACGFGYQTGSLTMRFSYVGPVVVEDWLSCRSCQQKRADDPAVISPGQECRHCWDWKPDGQVYDGNKDLPVDHEENCTYREVTFGTMKETASRAEEKMCVGDGTKWSSKQAKAVMTNAGMNGPIADRLVLAFQQKKETAAAEHNTTTAGHGTNNDQLLDEPDRLIEDEYPAKWMSKLLELKDHIIPWMHLAVLGVTKTVAKLLKELLTSQRKYSVFEKKANKLLKDVRTHYLEWMAAWEFGSDKAPFGPHVSTNVLGVCRMFKQLYSVLDIMKGTTDEEVDLADLGKKVAAAWVAVISRVMQDTYTDALIDDTERHVLIFLSLFTELDMCIMDMNGRKQTKLEKTSNMVQLLCLADTMRRYGPLRLYWEGSIHGEGILRFLKPFMNHGSHKPWFARSVMRRFYQQRGIKIICLAANNDMGMDEDKDEEEDDDDDEDQASKDKSGGSRREFEFARSLRKYKDQDEIKSRLKEGRSVSCIFTKDKKLMARVHTKRNESLQVYELIPVDTKGNIYDATWYCPFNVAEAGVRYESKKNLEECTNFYVMLLSYQSQVHQHQLEIHRDTGTVPERAAPIRSVRNRRARPETPSLAESVPNEMYYVVSNNHLERSNSRVLFAEPGFFRLPRVPGVTYA
jgi:hypothetical protein